jgi:serine/threonine protein kinase
MSGERMPMGEAVRIVLDVLDGLGYAHDEGVIHRDIKPSNILLTRRGEVVLADFGIAQIVGETRHTASGTLMGTLEYVAPEQGLEGQCDGRSDLYSLGIVFYEMLTGRTPFRADTPLAILLKHLKDPLPHLRAFSPRVPESIEQVVVKALAKDPQKRYANAAEMAAALNDAVHVLGLVVPDRVSLPVSFTTPEAPHEPVVVLSGTQRQSWVDAQQMQNETTVGLSSAKAQRGSESDAMAQDDDREGHPVGKAIVQAVGLLLLVNTAALTVAALADRWPVFASGWAGFVLDHEGCFVHLAVDSDRHFAGKWLDALLYDADRSLAAVAFPMAL